MLLTCYNITMKSGNPTSLVSLLPGGATNVQTAGSTGVPMVAQPWMEIILREFVDAGEPGLVTSGATLLGSGFTPTVQNNFVGMIQGQSATSANAAVTSGAANWVVPQFYAQPMQKLSFGVVDKITDAADSPSGFATAIASGPANANVVTTGYGATNAACNPGTLLTTDGNGNLTPFAPPAAAPTPTVTQIGTSTATTATYGIVAVSQYGTISAITTAQTGSSNSTLTNSNYNQITWVPVADAASYIVVRTSALTSPTSVGVIGVVNGATAIFNDTGIAALPNTSATQFFQRTAAPGTPTVVSGGTSGATTYQYKVSAILPNGVWSTESNSASATNCAAVLGPNAFAKITGTNVTGACLYAIDRTSSTGTPTGLGIIGFCTSLVTGFVDTGLPVLGTQANLVQTQPNIIPTPGSCYAVSLGTLSSGTSAVTSLPVFMGGL